MPKKKASKKTVEPPDYRQQAFWDLERTAEDCTSQVCELHNAVTELGSIVIDLIAAIDQNATAIIEALEKRNAD